MALVGSKKRSDFEEIPENPVIRVGFPRENKKVFDSIVKIAGDKGLSLADFGRMAMIHYVDQIKNKSIIL